MRISINLNKKIILIIFFIFLVFNILSDTQDYYPLNKIIKELNLKYKYDSLKNIIYIYKDTKTISVINDSPYILIDSKKYFINGFVKMEQGQYLMPKKSINILFKYFTGSNIEFNNDKKNKNNDSFYLNIKRNEYISNIENQEDEIKKNESIEAKNNYIFEEQPKNIKINAIIIDPGHGGSDPGAVGYSGTKEKDIVLKAGLILKDKLKNKYPDKKIVMTRDKDIFLSLEQRAKIANYVFNKYGPSLFISIHVNASRSSKSYGFETWILIEEYRRKIIKKGEISDDIDVENIIDSMLNDEIYKESKELSKKIQNSLENYIGDVSKNRGIKEQTYFVIKKSIMPAVLIEIGFNTNKYEENRLTKYKYLNKIADGIYYGIESFIYEYEKTFGYTR